ncbi:MAG: DUF4125 family protein [Chloroflexi bacterium]|nr:DUF4125 family protein [Chloroflexota bacterium]
MGQNEDLVDTIVEKEWRMFQGVQNIGGRAGCQDDFSTFKIMRSSQASSWSEATLESYLADLAEAERAGRNLLSEKYARMMRSTSPVEYLQIEHLLPALDDEVPPLIDKIVRIVLEWEDELSHMYPCLVRRGRPIHSDQDSPFGASLETYLRGELATYSRRTLELYHEHLLKLKSGKVNGSALVLENQVKQYGYQSIEAANKRLKQETSRGQGP